MHHSADWSHRDTDSLAVGACPCRHTGFLPPVEIGSLLLDEVTSTKCVCIVEGRTGAAAGEGSCASLAGPPFLLPLPCHMAGGLLRVGGLRSASLSAALPRGDKTARMTLLACEENTACERRQKDLLRRLVRVVSVAGVVSSQGSLPGCGAERSLDTRSSVSKHSWKTYPSGRSRRMHTPIFGLGSDDRATQGVGRACRQKTCHSN